MPRPKGFSPSPESRAKTRATLRARLKGEAGKAERERLLRLLDIARQSRHAITRHRPPAGTEEHRLFQKIRQALGSAAAHAELRRGV